MFRCCALVAFVSCFTSSGAARSLWTHNTTTLGKKERQYAVALEREAIKYVAGDIHDWPSSKRFVTFPYRKPSERVAIVRSATEDWKEHPEILEVLKVK
ncbi:unnamed protein product [Cylicocyclus nassatus]|uniref:Uncharacterized protein n=1 Tax=Cylicocyclus nassatus TaxID=53992 RepID=A0AA36GHH3_CYLNA|nr:unnamed protein product [Cylicocyclus nassatus]